jgi:Ca2+-binding RTX toxin-like protein
VDGRDGSDVIIVGIGNDTVFGANGDDYLDGGTGNDLLVGNLGDDTLKGGDGIDTLKANEGNDKLYGGGKGDILIGGQGLDRFVYEKLSDSTVGTTDGKPNFDQIRQTDVTATAPAAAFEDGDKIDLQLLDADTTIGGNQAFAWGGEILPDGCGQKGSLFLFNSAGGTLVLGNVDNDCAWEFFVEIEDGTRDASWYIPSDFIL